jgi:hypothetical protein
MEHLNSHKLSVKFVGGARPDGPLTPRAYTLTHSDTTGELFLTIGYETNIRQISGWYTRFMRDEVLAEWRNDEQLSLHVHCHVSGGLVFGSSSMRDSIFRSHLPMVLEAFRYGDQQLIDTYPQLAGAPVIIHFHAREKKLSKMEHWGRLNDYQLAEI